jgi:hypothetical protein
MHTIAVRRRVAARAAVMYDLLTTEVAQKPVPLFERPRERDANGAACVATEHVNAVWTRIAADGDDGSPALER